VSLPPGKARLRRRLAPRQVASQRRWGRVSRGHGWGL